MPTMNSPSSLSQPSELGVSGIILAGGLGQRMGGLDKGLLVLQGRPMVSWVAARLGPQVAELLLNANRNLSAYAALGYAVYPDQIAGFAGPLAGLHTGLIKAAHPLVVSVPCDSPFLPTDLVMRLHKAMDAAQAAMAVARCGKQLHPVFCLCRRALAPQLAAYLAAGDRRFGHWFQQCGGIEVAFDDQPEAFDNLNHPDELAALEQRPSAPG